MKPLNLIFTASFLSTAACSVNSVAEGCQLTLTGRKAGLMSERGSGLEPQCNITQESFSSNLWEAIKALEMTKSIMGTKHTLLYEDAKLNLGEDANWDNLSNEPDCMTTIRINGLCKLYDYFIERGLVKQINREDFRDFMSNPTVPDSFLIDKVNAVVTGKLHLAGKLDDLAISLNNFAVEYRRAGFLNYLLNKMEWSPRAEFFLYLSGIFKHQFTELDREVCRVLLAHHCNPNFVNTHGDYALVEAIIHGNEGYVQWLVEEGHADTKAVPSTDKLLEIGSVIHQEGVLNVRRRSILDNAMNLIGRLTTKAVRSLDEEHKVDFETVRRIFGYLQDRGFNIVEWQIRSNAEMSDDEETVKIKAFFNHFVGQFVGE